MAVGTPIRMGCDCASQGLAAANAAPQSVATTNLTINAFITSSWRIKFFDIRMQQYFISIVRPISYMTLVPNETFSAEIRSSLRERHQVPGRLLKRHKAMTEVL